MKDNDSRHNEIFIQISQMDFNHNHLTVFYIVLKHSDDGLPLFRFIRNIKATVLP